MNFGLVQLLDEGRFINMIVFSH